jgi:hypothetical protein
VPSRRNLSCAPISAVATAYIEEAQYGSVVAKPNHKPLVNLGLYSVTFNNQPSSDRDALLAFKEFRAEARRKGLQYFIEIFAPNIESGIRLAEIPFFVNDRIYHMLAGVSVEDRPLFLKVPYFGPRALEELANYDPSKLVGIIGGSSDTTFDAFQLRADAQKYGARVALFGHKICLPKIRKPGTPQKRVTPVLDETDGAVASYKSGYRKCRAAFWEKWHTNPTADY